MSTSSSDGLWGNHRHWSVPVLVGLMVAVSGCLYDPLPMPRRPAPRPRPRPPVYEGPIRPLPGPEYEEGETQGDRADQLLRAEIAYLEQDGVGGQSLTALRLTSEAWDLAAAGNEREALELLERAIAIDGSSGFAYLYLARLHYRAAEYRQAEQFLARARPLLPPDLRLNRALDRFEYDLSNQPVAHPAIQR